MSSELSKIHERTATRNAQAAVARVAVVESELKGKIVALEAKIASQSMQIDLLNERYILLLTNRFNGGSTA